MLAGLRRTAGAGVVSGQYTVFQQRSFARVVVALVYEATQDGVGLGEIHRSVVKRMSFVPGSGEQECASSF